MNLNGSKNSLLTATLVCCAFLSCSPPTPAKPILSQPLATVPATSTTKAAAPAPANDKMIRDVQVFHYKTSVMGEADLYLSDYGARYTARNGEIVIATCSPSWDVLLYSRAKNQGFKITNRQAGKQNLGVLTVPVDVSRGVKSKEVDPLLRYPLTKVFVDGKLQQVKSSDPFIFQQRKNRVVKDVSFKVDDIGPIKPELQNFVFWIFNEHSLPGLPAEAVTHFTDGTTVTQFHAVSKSKTSKPASFFAYPTDYKVTLNKLEVLIANDAQTTLEELWVPEDKSK